MGETDSKKKGPWTREEDQKLIACVQEHGYGSWRTFPSLAGLQRCGKSCRLRWTNYLKPDIKRGKFSTHEEKTIIRLHALLGTRWSAIAAHLPKRSDKEIKNYWNTRLKKRLTRMGIDPNTHKPRAGSSRSITHTAQWEAARLQAEARLRAQFELPRPPPPPCTVLDAVVPPISNLNEYACGVGVGVGVGQVDCYADTQQVADGEFVLEQFNQELEDDKSYWNYLLNLVSSSPLDFY